MEVTADWDGSVEPPSGGHSRSSVPRPVWDGDSASPSKGGRIASIQIDSVRLSSLATRQNRSGWAATTEST